MRIKWMLLFLGGILLSLTFAACGKAEPSRGGGGGCPGGTPAGSYLTSPPMWAVVDDLTPELDWAYADPSCDPDSYSIHLRTGPYFGDDLGGSSTVSSWSPSTSLEPGREYAWGVQAVNDSVTGPYSGEFYFFTGPMCVSGNLSAPIPLTPINNWIVDDLGSLSLIWWYPDPCLPDGYGVELSTSLVFNGSPLNGGTGNPSTRWGPGQPLTDCTRYYWRVRAIKDNQTGPYSQVYTFRVVISGGCPSETEGLIQGTVWEDQCVGPGAGTPMPNQAPLGCVLNGDQLFTNQTYDPGEPGIPGLIVNLGQGACPSIGYRSVETGPDGTFNFYQIPAGTYCVSVDAKDPINNPILIPGNWTFPLDAVNYILANQTVTVAAGQDVKNVDFGWWYKYGAAWGSTNATVFGLVWHDMCAYTPGDPIPDPLPAGCAVDQWGNVHADATRQADEPGIPGVVVDIGPGDCPSAGLATAVTDANGYYHFDDLPAGKYCLRIDPVHNPTNEAILMPGSWTVIPSGHENMTFRAITLTANHTLPGQDFGWDYDNLPLSLALPYTTLVMNAYCHRGPGPQFEASTYGIAGQSYHIEGISTDEAWYLIRFNPTLSCWVGSLTGKVTGDLSRVQRIFVPTETPTACSAYKNKDSCEAAGCSWAPSMAGAGVCKPK